jgi:hypothetical protein
MFEQRQHPARDAVAQRLVARHRQQEEHVLELVAGDAAAVDLGVQEHGQDVLARVPTLVVGEGVGVGEHVDQRGSRPRVHRALPRRRRQVRPGGHGAPAHLAQLGLVRRGAAGVLAVLVADDAAGPVVEEAPVAERDAHQGGQRRHRQVGRHLHEVHLVAVGGVVHQAAGVVGDGALEIGHGTGRERRGDERA